MIELEYRNGDIWVNYNGRVEELEAFYKRCGNGQAEELGRNIVSFVAELPRNRAMQEYRRLVEIADEIEARLGVRRSVNKDRIIEF